MAKHHKRKKQRNKKKQPILNPNFTWDSLDSQTKKTLILSIALLFSLTTMLAGTQFMLLLAMAVGVTSYALFGDEFIHWFNQHEYLLIGATFGLIATNFNPLGLFLGLWTGYFINRKLNQICELGSSIVEKAHPVVQPITYTTSKLNQLYQYTKNQCLNTLKWNVQNEVNTEQPPLKTKKDKKRKNKKKKRLSRNVSPQPVLTEIRDRVEKMEVSLNETMDSKSDQEILFETSKPFTKQYEQAQETKNTSSWKQWCYDKIEILSLSGG